MARELEGRAVSGTVAEPHPISIGRLTDTTAKRKGFQFVAVCVHCVDGIYKVAPGQPWLHPGNWTGCAASRMRRCSFCTDGGSVRKLCTCPFVCAHPECPRATGGI